MYSIWMCIKNHGFTNGIYIFIALVHTSIIKHTWIGDVCKKNERNNDKNRFEIIMSRVNQVKISITVHRFENHSRWSD